ncbi:DUF3828 domain-containing protein [Asticcacaulis sp. BYS171W]|uniref:DUF3828 domain-containing protein n=1 Tax=Asticcacaulis aquaticus TaxID=2984212 RepID=A0ABT5HSD7_9CAUL|nr:DUF3828 domain-containing protein [Asticcacaulis aquaticus]MDC7682980.1 DUF3828 domain-containing protein [Asticcacaulis aquaticus]
MHRRALLISLLVLSATAAQTSQALAAPKTPEAMIRAFYASYLSIKNETMDFPKPEIDLKDLFTPDLYKLYQKGEEEPDGDLPLLDWDVFANGQDVLMTEFSVSTEVTDATHQIVTARFKNFDTPMTVYYDFVLTKGKWRVTDVRYPGDEDSPEGFSLRGYLTHPPKR